MMQMLKIFYLLISIFISFESYGQNTSISDSTIVYTGYWIIPICDKGDNNFCFTKEGNPLDPFLSVYLLKDSTGKNIDTSVSLGYMVNSNFYNL